MAESRFWFIISLLISTIAAALIIGWLNLDEDTGESLAFGYGFDLSPGRAFAPSRGWPLEAVAPASEEGSSLARASLIQGDTVVYRNVFEDPRFPHLGVNWVFAAIDAFVAALLLVMAAAVPVIVRGARRTSETC